MLPLAERQGGGETGRALYVSDLCLRAGLCARSKMNHLRIETSQESLVFAQTLARNQILLFSGCSPKVSWISDAPLRTEPGAGFFFFSFFLS